VVLLSGNSETHVTIDVEARTVEVAAAGWSCPFLLDDGTRERLLQGFDDIALSLLHDEKISRFERDLAPLVPGAGALFDTDGHVLQSSD
jgi:3-isopropylmalate/(R)-2-methylmalate dehydratase small subunit